MATVCGLAAIPFFGVASPIYFLALPGRTPPEEAAPPSGNAVDPASFAPHSLASAAAARPAVPEEIAGFPDSSFAPPQPDLPEPVVFARGEFLFNRRFFETRLPGFFRVVLSEADKDLRIHIKSARGDFVGKRISRITASDLCLQVFKEDATSEEMIPFVEITEVEIRHKDLT
jgi:hypothetical protein